jgi:glycerate 2-kinase
MPPACILSGGETTVTLSAAGRSHGKGGPNSELGLSLALELGGLSGVVALAADTDGIDGSEDNAGCVVDETTLQRAREAGVAAADSLSANQAWCFFDALGDLVVSGPTDTNVNDFRVIYIEHSGAET